MRIPIELKSIRLQKNLQKIRVKKITEGNLENSEKVKNVNKVKRRRVLPRDSKRKVSGRRLIKNV